VNDQRRVNLLVFDWEAGRILEHVTWHGFGPVVACQNLMTGRLQQLRGMRTDTSMALHKKNTHELSVPSLVSAPKGGRSRTTGVLWPLLVLLPAARLSKRARTLSVATAVAPQEAGDRRNT
jgi:hypothetical protein